MKRGPFIAILLLFAAVVHVISLGRAADAMKMFPKDEERAFVLPSPILKIASLEFRGLVSDIIFLDAMVFIGESQQRKERPRVKDWEWTWFTTVLDTSTDLDPYFFDPYFYANAFLPWDAGRAEQANQLLIKGSRYRDWDWMLPFFIGFNDFFFLHKDAEAAPYLMEASRRPGGDLMYASIAARLAFKENRTETALFFLEETARRTDDQSLKKIYETRIQALQSIVVLEKGVSLYKKKFGKMPETIDELVNRNILPQLPVDPYGGKYYIAQDGAVKSTTSSELEPHFSKTMKSFR
jgi:hypothetical protein